MDKIIDVSNVTKTYNNGKFTALDDVSFSVDKGSLIGVLGRNGAGKSTLFKIICSVINKDSGKVSISNTKRRIDQISYLPEVRGLNPRELVAEHLVDLLCYKGIKRSHSKHMVKKRLAEFGMDQYANSRIDTLSKGNQQKIQFISVIANEPEILILDEPFSGLDIISTDFFWNTILNLSKKGTTILFSTHNLEERFYYCNYFMFLVKGKIVEFDSLANIQNNNSCVLELSCPTLTSEQIKEILGNRQYKEESASFNIMIKDEDEAKMIFEDLGSRYCSKFVVRKLKIDELFRLYNEVCYD